MQIVFWLAFDIHPENNGTKLDARTSNGPGRVVSDPVPARADSGFKFDGPNEVSKSTVHWMLDLRVPADFMSAFSFSNISIYSTPYSTISTDDEFQSPIEPSPANPFPRMWEDDPQLREVEQPVIWDGHTRIILGLNHLISMPAGPGWKELHIQPADTLQVQHSESEGAEFSVI